jgi:PIN domain
MEPLVAVYDACVLYPDFLRNFLVRLAIHGRARGGLRAKWTGRIHREWMRAVRRQRPDLDRTALLRTRRLKDHHVRGCRVRGYQRWERRLTLPDPDDRHVLAAALACAADVIVTFNTSDFPPSVLGPFGVAAVVPDAFALQLLGRSIVVAAAAEHRASLMRPPLSAAEYLDALRRNGLPGTAAALPPDRI